MLRKTVWVSTFVVAATFAGIGGALAQYRGGGYAPDYYDGGYGAPGYGGGAYADPSYGGRGGEPAPEPRRYREQSYDYDRAPPSVPYGYGDDQGPADPYYPDQGGGREPGRKASDLDLREGSQEATKTEVENPTRQPPGTIVIDTAERHLYFVEPNGQAIRYGIGVGREGFAWKGTAQVKRKSEWPDWIPPSDMLKRRPDLPTRMSGGIENPLGARAMYLFQGNRDTMFRIHGTNEPDSIGKAMSSGCIRMMNNDVIDLYSRVPVGTKVVVL